ncbi:uncharacterized protein ACBT57_019208 isoform 3-T6 [Dama dama]
MDAYSQTRRRQRSDPHVIPCCLCPISSRVWLSVELVCSVFSRKIKVIPRPAIKIYPWKPDDPFRRIWSFSVSMATVAAIQKKTLENSYAISADSVIAVTQITTFQRDPMNRRFFHFSRSSAEGWLNEPVAWNVPAGRRYDLSEAEKYSENGLFT